MEKYNKVAGVSATSAIEKTKMQMSLLNKE